MSPNPSIPSPVMGPKPRRDIATRFQPGHVPTSPGRPQGYGGRRKALAMLDAMLAEESNIEKLREAFQSDFDRDPVRFFRKIVMPLLPQGISLATNDEKGAVVWQSLLSTFPALDGSADDAETPARKP